MFWFCILLDRNKTLHEVASYLKLLPSPDEAGVEGNREFLLEMLVSRDVTAYLTGHLNA